MAIKTTIVLHHSATEDSGTVSWDAIKKYHMSWRVQGRSITELTARELIKARVRGVERPWKDIGYHAGVELVGEEYKVFHGRPWAATAAAVREARMNELGVHICMVGSFDLNTVPSAQGGTTAVLVRWVMHNVLHTNDVEVIRGHRDFAPYKSCPGRLFDLYQFRQDVGRL